jgi:hypothetical protein
MSVPYDAPVRARRPEISRYAKRAVQGPTRRAWVFGVFALMT